MNNPKSHLIQCKSSKNM